MKIIRKDPFTGISHSLELDVQCEDIYDWQNNRKTLLEITPNLTDPEREYMLTGVYPMDDLPRYASDHVGTWVGDDSTPYYE